MMSEPTYRITTEHDGARRPPFGYNPWTARAVRLTDGEPITETFGDSEAEVLASITFELGNRDTSEGAGGVYFATEDGEIMDAVPEPASLRVAPEDAA